MTESTERHEHAREGGMQALADRAARHYMAPMPEAEPPPVQLFPPLVTWGIWLGILLGAALGLVAHLLFRNVMLAVPGTEGLYSMTPYTFRAFWLVTGGAIGLLVVGLVTLLLASQGHGRRTDASQET